MGSPVNKEDTRELQLDAVNLYNMFIRCQPLMFRRGSAGHIVKWLVVNKHVFKILHEQL